jgi:SAM-dependent methyltransferase
MTENALYEPTNNTHHQSASEPTSLAPQWLANEYEAGNDGQFQAAYQALASIGVWSDLPPGRAVDVGCGSGRLVEALARCGWQVDGNDLSESMVLAARKRCHGLPVALNVCDARQLNLTPRHYELVTTCWMIHWLEDVRPTLQQLTNAVAPGGHLVLQWSCGQPRVQGFALRDTLQEVFDRPAWRNRLKDAPLAMYHHPLDEVLQFVSQANFDIISTRENIVVGGGENPQSLRRALRSAAFAAQTVVLGDDVDLLIDECLQLLIERQALQVANTELIARLK